MNISEKDYLIAKQIVKQYEKQNRKYIGIVCLDREDYNNYMDDLIPNDLYKFYKISKVIDLCSKTLDEYVVTELGNQNKEYDEIIKMIKINLKPKK